MSGCPILFVGNSATIGGTDQNMIDYMTSRGYTVDYVHDNVAVVGDAIGKSMIWIAENANSTTMANFFSDVNIGVIVNRRQHLDTFFMSTTIGGNNNNETSITISAVGSTHPLGAGLPAGPVTISGNESYSHVPGTFGAGIIQVATITGQPTQHCIFGYDVGGLRTNGTPSPGRRTFLFYRRNNGDPETNYNTVGKTLLNNALAWTSALNRNLDCNGVCGGVSIPDCAGICYDPSLGNAANTHDCDGICRPRCNGEVFEDCSKTCKICIQNTFRLTRFRSRNKK
tara:strand:- start:7521 stop:8372 length:852 start_codon:yes stop_codon:yes gene_type:complete